MPNKDKKLERADKIAAWRLCTGCGACKWACPNNAIELKNVFELGLRPCIDDGKCEKCGNCAAVCPGIDLGHKPFDNDCIQELKCSWGPVLDLLEGHACNDEIRHRGSSGGAVTALASYCLDKENISGVLHTGVCKNNPLKNIPVISKNLQDIIACTGSRYAPAAPCEQFDLIENSDGNYIFVGKPCDIAALRKAQEANPVLKEKVVLAISIFCAGTPGISGTYKVLESLGIDPEEVESFSYRGRGWPGMTTAKTKDPTGKAVEMTYAKSWGEILSKHVSLRCRLCPDGTGEFSDIACGDPWYRQIKTGESGRSLVVARTEKGKEVLTKAMRSGYIELAQVAPEIITLSQKSLLEKRRNIWGRLLIMRIMRIPIPKYRGFSLFSNWQKLSKINKARSAYSTLKRILLRKWGQPLKDISDDQLTE